MRSFTHDALGGRVVFGPGRRMEVPDEVDRLGSVRVMVVTGGSARVAGDEVADALGSQVVARWHEVAQHVPTTLADAARAAARDAGIDGIVAVGGGSTTGLAKAVALTTEAPIVAVPTTYAGSEMTPIYGLTGEHKETGRALSVLPRAVIYDPELTLDLPSAVTVASAFNALAHGVEALYGPGESPITALMAQEAIRAIGGALPVVMRAPRDLEARGELLCGAYLAGAALAAGIALHHTVCHVLGGSFRLVHGDVHTVMLPHVVAYNAPGAPDAIARLASAISAGDAAGGLFDLAVALRAPTSLAALGMPSEGLDPAAERVVAETRFNPVPVDRARVRAMLEAAWHGRRPSVTARQSTAL